MESTVAVQSGNQNNGVLKTCRLTIVSYGISDAVIKVYPAEHETEKVWLNDVRGVERWDMIKQNMERYAEKGTRVMNPVPYHNDPKNLSTVTLKEEDIPLVRLDGWILPKPPPEEKLPDFKTDQNNMLAINERINGLEKSIASLVTALAMQSGQKLLVDAPITTTTSTSAQKYQCCGRTFANSRGLEIHQRRMHKKKED